MENYFALSTWVSWNDKVIAWAQEYLLNYSILFQVSAISVSLFISFLLAPKIKNQLSGWHPESSLKRYFLPFIRIIKRLCFPLVFIISIGCFLLVIKASGYSIKLLIIVSNLLLAWLIIQLFAGVIKSSFWSRFVALFAWSIAALNITGLLEPTISLLDTAAFQLGAIRLSILGVLKVVLSFIVLIWLAMLFSSLFDRKISSSDNFTPSIRVLLSKLVKIIAFTVAILLALSSVGIDLTAFAVFSGAIGVGIGFGLQKIVSNFISGIILLLDKSIKPGDVVAVGEYYGRVDSLSGRYVSIQTRDGIEFLIPNEDLITQQVENWSYSNQLIRLNISVGVHYKSDVLKAIELCIESALEVERVLEEPKPVCLLKGFGDSAVDLEIRFWIKDPMNGRANVKSEILLKVWKKFHENNIEIPYPQRDLHLRSQDGVFKIDK